ncbi:MAG TPA: hypothetical protein VFZ63_01260 [Jiangellaceae bacterium]
MTGRRRVRALVVPALVGAICGLIGWLFGVVPSDAALVGLLVAAGVAVPRLAAHPSQLVWPAPPEPHGVGTWYEVRRLSTALSQSSDTRDVFKSKARPRLRNLAEARLTRHGVIWSDPAARRLLGPDAYDLLDRMGPDLIGRSPIALTELVLDRLDELSSDRLAGRDGPS